MDNVYIPINKDPVMHKLAGADLTGKEGYQVKLSTGAAVLCDAAGEAGIGVLLKGNTQGNPVSIALFGRVKLKLGGTLAAGAHVTTSTAGKAVAAAVNQFVMAELEEGGAADELVYANILKTYKPPATLNDLTDVVIATPTNNQVLKYETSSTTWKNAADATE